MILILDVFLFFLITDIQNSETYEVRHPKRLNAKTISVRILQSLKNNSRNRINGSNKKLIAKHTVYLSHELACLSCGWLFFFGTPSNQKTLVYSDDYGFDFDC